MRFLDFGRRPILRLAGVAAVGGVTAIFTSRTDAADGFLSTLEDLPLAPGLTEDGAAGLSFDSAAGRIVEAYARGDLSEDQVLDFYSETLPQLGWTRESATEYRRSGERLRLDLTQGGEELTVHYSLSPQ